MKNINVDNATYELLSDSSKRHGVTLGEMLKRIAGNEYERQQIESSKG